MNRESARRAQRGQVMVLFALAIPAMLALVGLVLDGGNIYLQRRTAQTAADAAALAATRAMQGAPASAATSSIDTVSRAVCNLAQSNAFGNTPRVTTAYFVRNNGSPTATGSTIVSDPSQCPTLNAASGYRYVTIPPDAAGVHVEVDIPFQTYMAGIIRITNLDAQAPATAMVANISRYDASNAPFIVCGIDTMLRSGTSLSILMLSGGSPVVPYRVNPSAVGQEFVVHGPNPHDISQCGALSTFKGLAEEMLNSGIYTLPADVTWSTGTVAGPTSTQVDGLNGCGPTRSNDCIMILPVATNSSGVLTLRAVLWAAFLISDHGISNYHYGVLQPDYVLGSGSRSYTWSWGTPTGGPITFALTQ
ncbi:MAG: pilus assembly protein TadG-related protein [Chloroflexota bacterium]|nr:pilus assembly protein TadG-related protein [Chloroflexota bacterium]